MKKVRFFAVNRTTESKEELEGKASEFVINEYGDEYRVPCFLHKKGRYWHVFEKASGLEVGYGRKTIIDALADAAATCLKFGGISATEKAIDRAVSLRGVINP